MAYQERYISTKKAKAAVRLAIHEFAETIRLVAEVSGWVDRVRLRHQLEDLDYLYDDIMRRMDESRKPAKEKEQNE